jgi:hypothetical protein
MEREDKIVAGLQRLHEDLEKLTASIEKQREFAAALTKRQSLLGLGVYLAVVGAFAIWIYWTYYTR